MTAIICCDTGIIPIRRGTRLRYGTPIPKAGDLSVVTNWQQEPFCIVETTHVAVVPYGEVSEAFAAIEGEGDGSLNYWRNVHWDYFSRECQRIDREPSVCMPVVCEQFKVVYP